VHCYRIYTNPYFSLLGCNTRLHGVPSAWVFVSRMLAEAKVSPSFSKPLNLQGPCSLVLRPVASCFETRVSPLFEVRVPPVLIEARVASCPRPTCLRFSRSLYLRLRVPTCNPKELESSNSNTYVYLYNTTPIPLKQWNSVTLTVIHYSIIVVLL